MVIYSEAGVIVKIAKNLIGTFDIQSEEVRATALEEDSGGFAVLAINLVVMDQGEVRELVAEEGQGSGSPGAALYGSQSSIYYHPYGCNSVF